jgi:hypothetical protein
VVEIRVPKQDNALMDAEQPKLYLEIAQRRHVVLLNIAALFPENVKRKIAEEK